MKKKQRVLSWLWQVSRGSRAGILSMMAAQVLLGASSVLSAWLLRGIINCAVDHQAQGFWRYGIGLVGLTLGQLTLRAVLRHLQEACNSQVENACKGRLFGVLLRADYGSVTALHSGQWMNRLTSDTQVVAGGLVGILPELAGMAVKLLGALALLLVLLPRLSLVILPGGALLVLLTWLFRKRLKGLHKSVQEADESLRVYLTEGLGAMLVLRAFGRQTAAEQAAAEKMDSHRAVRLRRNRFSNLCNIGFGLAMHGAYVLGALYCGYGILNGTMSYGTFTAVLQLIGQVQSPFANLSGFVPRFYATLASAERLMEAESFPLDCPEGSLDPAQVSAFYDSLGEIRLDNVTFTYPGEQTPALENRSLSIPKGSYVALTGPSGCGKSTTLKLLLALYPMEGGSLVTQGGSVPITARYRTLFSYVPQDNALISGTVRQAVTFGSCDVPEEKLWQALEIACAADFVRREAQGLDTLLGERGTGLSEGQLQRLSIARAVLSDRPVLLLDEATSALDEATEAAVLRNLRAMTDKTVVIVTHRPAALEICDLELFFG